MTDTHGSTWLNALIGGIGTIVLSFTIVSPVLGGAIAGYLERTDGVRVGALAGLMASIPVLLFGLAIIGLLPAFGPEPLAIGLLVILLVVVIVPVYVISLSALGGYLGTYLRQELHG